MSCFAIITEASRGLGHAFPNILVSLPCENIKEVATIQNFNEKSSQIEMIWELSFCDPAGIRTQDPNIKSVVLYQLSY